MGEDEFTKQELSSAINSLSSEEAIGTDNILAEVLKENIDMLLPSLHKLYIKSYRESRNSGHVRYQEHRRQG